ncbi:hypothetical protein KFU94_24800 [Chloroflexi bacterium TSY]|nr:hypothetical protein [Chloroflexi bacterium TSY]
MFFRTIVIFLLFWSLYWGTALLGRNGSTPSAAYFHELAEAWLNGHLYLAAPSATLDLTMYQGQWFLAFPPLPALLMLPIVALRGAAGTNTVLFSTFFGGLNVAFVYVLLNALAARGWSHLDRQSNLWLTLLFGLGSVHWYMATAGSVWFVAQICTITFIALAVWFAIERRPAWLAGLALGIAMLARPNVALTSPLLLGIAAMHQTNGNSDETNAFEWRSWIQWAILSAVPMALIVVALLGYNLVRFDDPLEFGYTTMNVSSLMVEDLEIYGQFHPHFFWRNLHAMLFALPLTESGRPGINPYGLSLFITTPALLYLVFARGRTPLILGAWMAVLLLIVPLTLYYNTGYWQFGYRFSLDFMVPVMILLALATGKRVGWMMRGMILIGVFVNAIGVVWWYW